MLKHKRKIDELPQDDSAHESQKLYIYNEMVNNKVKVAVEIGTHKGVTALYMAHALYDLGEGKLYTYDPVDYNQQSIFDEFPDLSPLITYKKAKAIESDVKNIDFVFVDGYHEKEFVLEEIKHFLPRLNKGAIMLFHDAGGDNEKVGVNAAIAEAGLEVETIVLDGTMKKYVHSPTPPKGTKK